METGVAIRPIENMEAYYDTLNRFVFRSGLTMKPVFAAAKTAKRKRIIYANGEDERVLRAAQIVLEEQTAVPLLIGRPHVVEARLKRFGLRIRPNIDFELTNPENDPRFRDYVNLFLRYTGRRGVSPEVAKTIVRTSTTAIAALAVMREEADAMICGLEGRFERHLELIEQVIGLDSNVHHFSAVSLLISPRRTLFLTDTYVNEDPSAEEIAEMTVLAAQEIEAFGITPKAALLSHSNFGSKNTESARKMRRATEILAHLYPDLEADGEMHGDAALSTVFRDRVFLIHASKEKPICLSFQRLMPLI